MIEKIKQYFEQKFENKLDVYYAKKSAEQLYYILRLCCITIKYTKGKNCYYVYVKKSKEDAKYYKEFYRIYFKDGFETFSRIYNANKKEIRENALKLLEG